jgi:plastocyanin
VIAASGGTVQIIGDERFVPDAMIMATFRFTPGPLEVRSGEQVTWQNTTIDPHTVSVVRHADVPTTVDQAFDCQICSLLRVAHFPNGFDQPPALVIDDFKPAGFPPSLDNAGDSFLIGSVGGPGDNVTALITAAPGSTLDYICAIHPWMQGTIRVH